MELKRCRNDAVMTLDILRGAYPDARCALEHRNPWELLVATILSAQCTDARVNVVTKSLFEKFPDIESIAAADVSEIEESIRSTGFFRGKARSLIGSAQLLLERHEGRVPGKMKELLSLPGVGRKTANVILGNAFNLPGMVVDTHVKRLAWRLGWTNWKEPELIEKDLCELLPSGRWTEAGHILIAHGRAICKAVKPLCSMCPVQERCPRRGVSKSG